MQERRSATKYGQRRLLNEYRLRNVLSDSIGVVNRDGTIQGAVVVHDREAASRLPVEASHDIEHAHPGGTSHEVA